MSIGIETLFDRVSQDRAADRMGWVCVLIFAATAWSIPDLGQWALYGSSVACLMSPAARSALPRHRAFQGILLFCVFVIAQTFRGADAFPETEARQWADCRRWLLLAIGLPAVGWWLKADPRRIKLAMTVALIGFLAGMLRAAKWSDVVRFRSDWQTGFQTFPSTSALICVTAVFALLLFLPRMFGGAVSAWRFRLRAGLWLIALYLCLYVLVVSQSRGTWLAAVLVLPALAITRWIKMRRTAPKMSKRLPALALLVLMALGIGIAINADTLVLRTGQDVGTVALILQGRDEQLPESSFGYRYRVQKFGFQKWLERPVFGWGTASNKALIARSNRPELFYREFGRWIASFHNGYLEILVRFGLAGLIFFAAAAGYAARAVRLARRQERLPADYGVFLLGSLGITVLWGFSSHYLLDPWQAYWLILAGSMYSFAWHPISPAAPAR